MKRLMHPTRAARKSIAVSKKLGECSKLMKAVGKFFDHTRSQMYDYEHQIRLLTAENNHLRKKLQMPPRKAIPVEQGFEFIFPDLKDSPVEILNRKIEEILPLTDNMDSATLGIRTRILGRFRDCGWETITHMFQEAGDDINGPEWKGLSKYRDIGKGSLAMIVASFNHFRVDRKNLPPKTPG